MKKFKRTITLMATVCMLSAGSITAMAAVYDQTPADVAAGLSGRPVEDVIEERFQTGKTYGMIAAEAGKLDEFKEETLKLKEELLRENVEDGLLSQEEADEIIAAIKARQAICDGTGYGAGMGCGGYGRGTGFGRGLRGGCRYYNN